MDIIRFKGVDKDYQAIVVFGENSKYTKAPHELVPEANRSVLEIHFPAATDYADLIAVYNNEDALSEISIIDGATNEIYVHLNYIIPLSLSLQAYGTANEIAMNGPDRWIMQIAQLTDADKQFRKIVGVAAKSAAYLTLEEYKDVKIQLSKEKLEKYLKNNPLISDCKDSVYNALKHNTLAIGYIGIAEMCQALFGKNHAEDPDVHKFALNVVKRINEFAKEASERNNLNFSCYATPAEGLCSTALKALRKQYGIIDKVTSNEFLTNSHHVPVWEKVSIYDKLRIEAPFCKYPTGGCITYIELDSTFVKNTKAIEDIIRYAFEELDIPYLAFNFPIDTCMDCGFQGEFNNVCPTCGSSNILQLRRVTGYLTLDWHNFNSGKQAEVQQRVKHSAYTNFTTK